MVLLTSCLKQTGYGLAYQRPLLDLIVYTASQVSSLLHWWCLKSWVQIVTRVILLRSSSPRPGDLQLHDSEQNEKDRLVAWCGCVNPRTHDWKALLCILQCENEHFLSSGKNLLVKTTIIY